jgi:hypothetical protein
MIDPLSTIAAPPPRYLLESDSSDEEGQGAYAGGSVPKIRTAAPEISVRWTDAVPGSLTGAVVGVGQAGKYLARRAGARMALLVVEIGGTTVGTGFAFGEDGILVVLEEMEKGAFEVVETLVGAVKAESW